MVITNTEAADAEWLPFLLQTSDALFPTGAYAHSLGFEELVRLGMVSDEETLRAFLLEQVLPAQREQELPYLRFAILAAEQSDIGELCALDREISAWKLAAETREASIQLGGRRLRALQVICADGLLERFASAITQGEAHGHHLVIYGLQANAAKTPLQVALMTYLYQALAAVCSAALKLIRVGQDGIQRALREACRKASDTVKASLGVQREHSGWFNPLLEIASMRHARADERLFIS